MRTNVDQLDLWKDQRFAINGQVEGCVDLFQLWPENDRSSRAVLSLIEHPEF